MAMIPFIQGLDEPVAGRAEGQFDLMMRNARSPCDVDGPVLEMIGVRHAADGPVVPYASIGARDGAVRGSHADSERWIADRDARRCGERRGAGNQQA